MLTFVDTPGAYPGIGAEERGQSEAIGRSLYVMAELKVPIVCTVIGEGGSGGAVALAVGNKVLMLEHSIYSVISPEGCAAILWRSGDKAKEAADALKLTAQDLYKLRVIDAIISEPTGGAQRHPHETVKRVGHAVASAFAELDALGPDADFRALRRKKFLDMGKYGLA